MTTLENELRWIVDQLTELSCPFAVVGGLAVSARAEPRLTRDVDIAVIVDDDQGAESLSHDLVGRGCAILALVEQEATGRLATVRLSRSTATDVVLDCRSLPAASRPRSWPVPNPSPSFPN